MATTSSVKIGGKERPVHYGHWALKLICDRLQIEYEEVFSGTYLTKLENQFVVASIGLREGRRLAGDNGQDVEINERVVADWLDEEPDALDSLIMIYFEQVYGRSAEKLEKAGRTEEAEMLKNVIAQVMNATRSPSSEFGR